MILAINCKTYPTSTGQHAVRLAKICERVAKRHKLRLILAVPALDVQAVAKAVSLPVYVEHIDASLPGKSTGAITIEAAKAAGAKGTILNHSEKSLSEKKIRQTIARCKKNNLKVLLCAKTPQQAKKLVKYKPDLLAVEPPALIGGKKSVSKSKPSVITNTVQLLGKTMKGKVLVGAGIHSHDDIIIAKKLGAAGVLLASNIDLAKNQHKALEQLLTAIGRRRG